MVVDSGKRGVATEAKMSGGAAGSAPLPAASRISGVLAAAAPMNSLIFSSLMMLLGGMALLGWSCFFLSGVSSLKAFHGSEKAAFRSSPFSGRVLVAPLSEEVRDSLRREAEEDARHAYNQWQAGVDMPCKLYPRWWNDEALALFSKIRHDGAQLTGHSSWHWRFRPREKVKMENDLRNSMSRLCDIQTAEEATREDARKTRTAAGHKGEEEDERFPSLGGEDEESDFAF